MKFIDGGAYGKVYKKNNSSVIKKTKILNDSTELSQQNLHEVIFSKIFRHSNIADVKSIVIKDDEYHIEMVKYDISLEEFIKRYKYIERLKHLDNIFYQLVCALHFIHINGLIHGDLKPRNIMYNNSEKIIKIIDFGCISTFRFLSEHNTLCTLHFRPPEGFKKFKNGIYDGKFDIWSLGATIYYYLTKDYIINIEDDSDEKYIEEFEKLMKIGNKVRINVKIEKNIKLLLKKMLYYDPKKRISIDELINHKYFKKYDKIGSPLNDLSSIKFPLSKHLSPKFDTSFLFKLDEFYIKKRGNIVGFIYDLCKSYQKLNCFVLSITLIDIYLCKCKSLEDIIKYKGLAVSVIILVSNILSEYPFTFSDFSKIIKIKYEGKIMNKIKDILNVLGFELYYNTFDWVLYKCIYPSAEIDYEKIKNILSNVNNIGKDNDCLINLYLEN